MEPNEVGEKQKEILKAAQELSDKRATPKLIADQAGVSVNYLGQQLQDGTFRSMFNECLVGAVASETPQILQSFIEQAKQGSFKHGKLLLEISDMYSEKSQLEVNAKTTNDTPFSNKEERDEFLKATLQEFLEEQKSEEGGE